MSKDTLKERVNKAQEAIGRAIKFLEEANAAHGAPEFAKLVWKAASELEYSALIISVVHGLSDYIPEIPRSNPGKASHKLVLSDSVTGLRTVLQEIDQHPKEAYAVLRRVIHEIRELI